MKNHRGGPALFVSDLHLSDERPATTAAFLAFLHGPARSAHALYVLGDLFEYWAGDDDAEAPLNRSVGGGIAELAAEGTVVFFMPGNRDFLLGERFARQAGFQLLRDPTLIEIGGRRVLLSHGDLLCTDDREYLAYREQVRDKEWQQNFLSRPLSERKQFIEGLRQRSEAAKQVKAMRIMDVNPGAVEAVLREHRYPDLVHGHTHRPGHHVHVVDGRPCDRWVLADWHGDAPYLCWDADGPKALRFSP